MSNQVIHIDDGNGLVFRYPADKYLSRLSIEELKLEMEYRISKEEYEICSLIKRKIAELKKRGFITGR